MVSISSSAADQKIRCQPLNVAERCWMISSRDPESLLQCNTDLRIFPGPRQGTCVCIDPGSRLDAPAVEANIQDLTGGSGLDFITVNYQDADVTGNLPELCQTNPAATLMLPAFAMLLARQDPGGFYEAVAGFLVVLVAVERALARIEPPQHDVESSSIENPDECSGCQLAIQ